MTTHISDNPQFCEPNAYERGVQLFPRFRELYEILSTSPVDIETVAPEFCIENWGGGSMVAVFKMPLGYSAGFGLAPDAKHRAAVLSDEYLAIYDDYSQIWSDLDDEAELEPKSDEDDDIIRQFWGPFTANVIAGGWLDVESVMDVITQTRNNDSATTELL